MNKDNLFNKNYFDKQSSGYAFNEERRKIFQYHLDTLFSLTGKIKKLLDIGCGFGYFLSLCDKLGIETFGLEISDYAINQAKKFTKAKIFKEKKFLKVNEFDAVTAFDVLEHLRNDEEMLRFIYRKIRKNGWFYGTTPNKKFILNPYLKEEDPTHINVHEASYWLDTFKRVGFKNIRIKHILSFGFPPTPILREKLRFFFIKPIFTPIEIFGEEILFMAQK